MNRDEHLHWAQQRALAYLPDDPHNAFASMQSDMRKHEELARHPGLDMMPWLLQPSMAKDPNQVQRWILGFQ